MGASKEGVMSVRDKINSVLHDFFSEEEDDPPDIGDSRDASSETLSRTMAPATHSDKSRIPSPLSLSKPTVESSPSNSSGGGKSKTAGVTAHLISTQLFEAIGNSQQIITNSTPRTSSSESGGGKSSNNVAVENSIVGGVKENHEKIGGLFAKEDGDKYVLLQELLVNQLKLIQSLQERLGNAESTCETVSKERDQLKETLNCERREKAEARNQYEASIKSKNDRIQELERKLAEISKRKSSEDKGTCVSPPYAPANVSMQESDVIQIKLEETYHQPEDDTLLQPPTRKRARLDLGRYETEQNFLVPSSHKVIHPSSSYQSPRDHHRRSDSPPQLSPAVTPKSTPNNSFGRPGGLRSILGQDVNEYGTVGPPDEFQDELDRINHACHDDPVSIGSSVTHFSRHEFPSYSQSSRTHQSSSADSTSSSSSSFNRPKFAASRHTRFIFPEGKKGFLNNNVASNRSFLPVNKSRLQYSSPDNSLPKGTMAVSSKHSTHYHNHHQHHGNRNRSNNFLNLSRPFSKKSHVVIVPSSHSPTSPTLSPNFRSLDESAATTAANAASFSSSHFQEVQSALVPSTSPPVVKKRKVGRPPGSGLKSKFVQRSQSSSFSSPGDIGTPSGQQLLNGSIGPLEPACPPPQRFSQRGRLLKPNRARYSPEPEINVREKYMTTKKGYYVGEPFVHTGYPEEEHEGGLHIEESSRIPQHASSPCRESAEETMLALAPSGYQHFQSKLESYDIESGSAAGSSLFVEVPKWRVNIVEGFSDSEGRHYYSMDDDMSDEAFLKRHQKLEAKEKQRKRWDSQRMREESYLERLKRKQEERERLKELRRQQRKRNKGRNGASEEESVTPSAEEIKAIHIGSELPVGAFGHPLPLVEKVDFCLDWHVAPYTTEKPSTPTLPPSQEPKSVVSDENDTNVGDLDNDKGSDRGSDKVITASPTLDELIDECSRASSPSTDSTSSTRPSASGSSPSLSSSFVPLIPSSPSTSPIPFFMFPAGDSDNHENMETRSDWKNLDAWGPAEGRVILDVSENSAESFAEEDDGGKVECAPCSPLFTVELVDYVDNDPLAPNECYDEADAVICDISTAPSISIPLQSPCPASNLSSPPELKPLTTTGAADNIACTEELKPESSAVVRFPISFSKSDSPSSTNFTKLSSSFSSSTSVSKTSIRFTIPNNPLAPRHHSSSCVSASAAKSSSLTTNKSSDPSSSVSENS